MIHKLYFTDGKANERLKKRFVITREDLMAHKVLRHIICKRHCEEKKKLRNGGLLSTTGAILASPSDRRSCIGLKKGQDFVCFHHLKRSRHARKGHKPPHGHGPSGSGTQRPGPNKGHGLHRQGHCPHGHGHGPHGHRHGPHGHGHGPHGHGHGPNKRNGAGSGGRQSPQLIFGNEGRNDAHGPLGTGFIPPVITLDDSPTGDGKFNRLMKV